MAASNSRGVGSLNLAMDAFPLLANQQKFHGHYFANLHYMLRAKALLVHQRYRARGAIQREARPGAIPSQRVNVRGWMVIGIKDHPDATQSRDSRHGSL